MIIARHPLVIDRDPALRDEIIQILAHQIRLVGPAHKGDPGRGLRGATGGQAEAG
ncbi:MAG: hypothetical protein QGH25_18425 [Candidatus Latescibacteria bacterium]|nr:hypothetical protein [Candidatus Latescibacterota bacterium]